MGDCCCKEKEPDETIYAPTSSPVVSAMIDNRVRIPRLVDPKIVDQLVLEMLNVAASRVDT